MSRCGRPASPRPKVSYFYLPSNVSFYADPVQGSSASRSEEEPTEEIAMWEAPQMVFDLIGEIDRQLNTQ